MLMGKMNVSFQKTINKDSHQQALRPRFTNQPPLRPLEAEQPMDMVEADTVNLSSKPAVMGKKTYKYVLAVECVMSRYRI